MEKRGESKENFGLFYECYQSLDTHYQNRWLRTSLKRQFSTTQPRCLKGRPTLRQQIFPRLWPQLFCIPLSEFIINLIKILKYKKYENVIFLSILPLCLSFFLTNCAQEDFDIPKLECTQPDLKVNQTVAQVKANANAIVAQYPFEDIIEAYVVSSDEGGNFSKALVFKR